jgi:hypothetical protein
MSPDSVSLPVVEVFSRPGCHLCEELIEELMPLARDRFTVEVHNIDTREDWSVEYAMRIPVVRTGAREICQYHLDVEALHAALYAETASNSTS